MINQKKQFNQSYFTSHNDNEIHKLCVDLLADKHIISENWALRHKIYTSIESQNLKKTAEKSVLMLKLQHVEDEIQIIQSKIKTGDVGDKDISLLNNLIKIKNKISTLVGRNAF